MIIINHYDLSSLTIINHYDLSSFVIIDHHQSWLLPKILRGHIMRGGLRPPTQQDGRCLRRRPPCWVSHCVVTCGFQRGAALASAVPHWFPHVRRNVPILPLIPSFQSPSYTSPSTQVHFPCPCGLPHFHSPLYATPSSQVFVPSPCATSSFQCPRCTLPLA